MASPKVGIAITALALVAATGIIGYSVQSCEEEKPTIFVEGFGMRGDLAESVATSTKTWPGFQENLKALYHAPEMAALVGFKIERVSILIVPSGGKVISPYLPSGEVSGHDANGTIDMKRPYGPLGDRNYIAIVRKTPGSACDSALTHEVIEHALAFDASGDLNWNHAAKWREISTRIEHECRAMTATVSR